MSDEYVHDEVVTLFVTGQETSAVALSWAVALLAQHPEFQQEAAAEIAHVTNGREVMAEDYPRLRLLNAIVQETVRLYLVRERMFGYSFVGFIERLTASTHTVGTTALEDRSSVISPLGEGSEAASLSILPWRNWCWGLLLCYPGSDSALRRE